MLLSLIALVASATAAPLNRRDVSGVIQVNDAYIGAADANGAFTLVDDQANALPVSIGGACGSAGAVISSATSTIGASSATLENAPSYDQLASIHESARLLRLAQDKSNAAIEFVVVQAVRRDAAASVMTIRFSDYQDAQTDLENQEAGWSTPYTASQNDQILHWFDNAQGPANEAYKADYLSCVAAKRDVVQANVTITEREAALEGYYISGSYPSDAAAEADRVAKIAARYEDYACVNYTTIIYSSLSPNSTAVLANNTALDLVEARRLAVIAAAEVDVAAGVLAEASATADSNSAGFAQLIDSTSESAIWTLSCADSTLSASYVDADGTVIPATAFVYGTGLALSGNLTSTSGANSQTYAPVVLTFVSSS